MRKLPYPNVKPNASIKLDVSVGITNNGAEATKSWEGEIILIERHKRIQTKEGTSVQSVGKVFIFHDVFEDVYELSGTAFLKGKKHIFSGSRLYNPDGSVHHVELELM